MKIKQCVVIILVFTSQLAVCGDKSVLSDLKKIPVNAYDSGKIKLESVALAMQFMNQSDIAPRLDVIEDKGMLGVRVEMHESARYMTDERCKGYFDHRMNERIDITRIPKLLWPNLNEQQSSTVMNELFVTIRLVARENNSFVVSCTKNLAQIKEKIDEGNESSSSSVKRFKNSSSGIYKRIQRR